MQLLSYLSPKTTVNLLNPDEADANRRGEITPAQNDRLNAMALGRQGCGTFIAAVVHSGLIFFFMFSSLLNSGGMSWFFLLAGGDFGDRSPGIFKGDCTAGGEIRQNLKRTAPTELSAPGWVN